LRRAADLAAAVLEASAELNSVDHDDAYGRMGT
jgi:hypothetical protein